MTTTIIQETVRSARINLTTLASHSPAIDDLRELADWLAEHGADHLSAIERIELADWLITRRRFLIGAAALAVGAITGCGAPSGGASPAVIPDGWPRTIEHAGGSLTLSAPPERIVVANAQFVRDDVLALNVEPVLLAVTESIPLTPWLLDAGAGNLPPLDVSTGQPNLEVVAAVRPDIVIDNVTAAPSVYADAFPLLGLDFKQSVDDRLRLLGRALPARNDAEQIIANLDQMVTSFQPAWRPQSITIFSAAEDGPFVYLPASGPGFLLQRLGLPLSDRGRAADEFGFSVSFERLDALDADLVITVVPYPDFTAPLDALEANPLFQMVPAVAAGRYVRLDPVDSQAFLWASALSIPVAVAVLTRTLADVPAPVVQ
ncbi:MAG: ABC transporter substrate-binding protein [Blastochloris sp.]|nr:ABC transporter substrate-binding protein [Blastochloris sp.]